MPDAVQSVRSPAIEGLDGIFAGVKLRGRDELIGLIERVLRARTGGRVTSEARIGRSRVRRLRVDVDGEPRALIVKYLTLDRSLREQRVVGSWLPASGLAAHGPPVLGVAGIASGAGVWHVYEDLGDCALAARLDDPGALRSGLRVVARLHSRFADHPLLGDCRAMAGDLGRDFYLSSVRNALRALDGLRTRPGEVPREHRAACDRLGERLGRLLREAPERLAAFEALQGPDTLLHGDLWPINVLVVGDDDVRLIDWDRTGVGPAAYDLSTLLRRLPIGLRSGALADYRGAGGRVARDDAGPEDLNHLFETAECARLANCVVWPALDFWEHRRPEALERLAEIDGWFERLDPLLPVEPRRSPIRDARPEAAGLVPGSGRRSPSCGS